MQCLLVTQTFALTVSSISRCAAVHAQRSSCRLTSHDEVTHTWSTFRSGTELSDVSLGLSLSFASQRCTVCSYVSTRRSQYVYSWLRKKKDTRDHDMHSTAVCDTKMFDVMLRSS